MQQLPQELLSAALHVIWEPGHSQDPRAVELVAQQHGVDLGQLREDFAFMKDRRWIEVWRKDLLPGTGPADEPLGTLHYSMQGPISRLPNSLQQSVGAFQGMWSEAGTLESIEQ